jgi:drug/metabolite transporter (DMT)-like permease
MEQTGAGAASTHVRGIILMIVAFAFFAGLDACAKFLSASMATPQIVWARYAGHLVVALLMFAPMGVWDFWRTDRLGLQLLRSLFLFAATACNFVALRYLQLAETAAIFFTVPLIVAALSVPMLGEHVGPRRWTAITIGFVGVLIVVRPGFGLVHWAVFLSFGAAFFASLYMITTRKLSHSERDVTTQFYTALIGAAIMMPFVPFGWQTPTGINLGIMIVIGILGGIGHFILILAHRFAPAPILAPFVYVQIIWMVGLGFFVFSDLPDRWTILGAAVVVGSGLYLLYRERTTRQGN